MSGSGVMRREGRSQRQWSWWCRGVVRQWQCEADLVEADCALLELVSEDSGGVEMQGVNRIENPQFSQ